ncbi:unnamed protein product [Clavelina lepadiformis]|uniref:Fucosyltransferase n=1 Tax=Clavelina lepadiformis TaxID=159417 RepID=A0ABP0FPB7_CLALP
MKVVKIFLIYLSVAFTASVLIVLYELQCFTVGTKQHRTSVECLHRNWHKTSTDKSSKTIRNPLILYWDYPWHVRRAGDPEGTKIGVCETTYNRNMLEKADAVVFHYTVVNGRDIPWRHYRHPKQIFVWWSGEAPPVLQNENYQLDVFDGFFNWTWTYRRDADVLRNYGYRGDLLKSVEKGKDAIDKIIAKKKRLAIWVVSQCDYTEGAKKRIRFAKRLARAGVKFTAFGKCFVQALPRSNEMRAIVQQHKFYLAFENAIHCTDYITEKFWNNGLFSDTVPVVWGPKKEDLLEVAPLDSFIFAEDFETPEKLAEYLLFVDKNDEEYRKYFRWREDPNITDAMMIEMTRERYPDLNIQTPPKTICDKLLYNRTSKTIRSLLNEFWDRNPPDCIV